MVASHHIITMKLTWKEIKAHPILAIREVREIKNELLETRDKLSDCRNRIIEMTATIRHLKMIELMRIDSINKAASVDCPSKFNFELLKEPSLYELLDDDMKS